MRSGRYKLVSEAVRVVLSRTPLFSALFWKQLFLRTRQLTSRLQLPGSCQHPSSAFPARTHGPSTADTGHPESRGLEVSKPPSVARLPRPRSRAQLRELGGRLGSELLLPADLLRRFSA
ncbi:hypothetical protein VULLAG_LOCUS19238 [Vulpes lagopus]